VTSRRTRPTDLVGRDLPVSARCEREVEKVGIQGFGRGSEVVVADQEVTHDFTRPGNLTQPGAVPSLVGHREMEQLECAIESSLEARRVVSRAGTGRAPDFAADVPELFRQRERLPAPGSQFVMHRTHSTSRSTIAVTLARVAGSSTPRDRFAWLGRMLIIESNSMKSVLPYRSG